LERLRLNGDETLIDAGCGTAELLERLPARTCIGIRSFTEYAAAGPGLAATFSGAGINGFPIRSFATPFWMTLRDKRPTTVRLSWPITGD
jgi:hypothetical protein